MDTFKREFKTDTGYIINLVLGYTLALVLLLSWINGVVTTYGFWMTLFAIVFPPYDWYLTVGHIINLFSPITVCQ